MNAAVIVQLITAALGEVTRLLFAAFVDGDRDAYRRVREILPEESRLEAKVAHEEARLRALEASDQEDTDPGRPQ